MPTVAFGNVTVDVPDQFLSDPKALAKIGEQVRFSHRADTTSGADAKLRAGLAGLEKPEDQVNYLRGQGLEAAHTGRGLTYLDPKTQRPVLADEEGLSARDLIDLAPMAGSIGGSILGALGGATVGNVPGALIGSGAGAAAGKEGVSYLMRQLGGADDRRDLREVAKDVGTEFALGAVGEGVGRMVGATVKALRPAPSALDTVAVDTARALDLPVSAGMAGSPTGRMVENFAAQSVAGRGLNQRAAAAQNAQLGQMIKGIAPVEGTWPRATPLHLLETGTDHGDLLTRAAASGEVPTTRPLRPFLRNSFDDQVDDLAKGVSPKAVREAEVRRLLTDLGGGDAFDATNFVTRWDRLDPRLKYLVGKETGLTKSLNAVIPVIRRAAEFGKRANAPKETALGSIAQILGIGGSFTAGGPVAAGAATLAPAVLAKVFQSKPVLNWLTRIPKDPGAWSKHLAKLATIAEGRELYDKLQGHGARAEK